VIAAVREGNFHIWSVETVEQGIEILTGMPAGERLPDGTYPEGTVYGAVDAKLREMDEKASKAGKEQEEKKNGDEAHAPVAVTGKVNRVPAGFKRD
jgi:hypothetical protein